ncbi:MAG TPA: hypothetical protein VE944_32945, partial [Nostoc sp.]|uniref:hypothetical protein n=1 Tax=Nostoc sp. TaxID=1180 RepID=UPI002D4A459F
MSKNINEYITLGFAIGGNLIWGLIFFSNTIKRRYAAERDFNHLKNNQKQILDNLGIFFKDIDNRFDIQDRDLLEIKAYLIGKG